MGIRNEDALLHEMRHAGSEDGEGVIMAWTPQDPPYAQVKLDAMIHAAKLALEKSQAKEPPKKESKFLDQVQSAIDRQRIFRKRVAAIVGGPVLVATAPAIGVELFKWWNYLGVDHTLSAWAGTLVGVGVMSTGAAFTMGAILKSIHSEW